jgi:hypothetical protein
MLGKAALFVVCLCAINVVFRFSIAVADFLFGGRPKDLTETTTMFVRFVERTWLPSAIIIAMWFLI